MKTIAVYNKKGGCGKTSSVISIGSYFEQKGKKVLLIDLDESRNLSTSLNIPEQEQSSMDLFSNPSKIKDCMIQVRDNLWIVPSTSGLASLDTQISKFGEQPDMKLNESISVIKGEFDYCIVDCPPKLGLATVNAISIENVEILIPSFADSFGYQGIISLIQDIQSVKESNNPSACVMGIFFTQYQKTNLTNQFIELIREVGEERGIKVCKQTIRNSIKMRESESMFQSIFEYDPNSKIAKDYESLIKELEV